MSWPIGSKRVPTAANIEAELMRECKEDPHYIYRFLAELKFDFSDLKRLVDHFKEKVERICPPDSERRMPKKPNDLEIGEKSHPVVDSDD